MSSNQRKPDGHCRVLPFRGVPNFRDLGGYDTQEGKRVKWEVLYRSGHLAKLSRSDWKRFERLNIHTVIDLRSTMEQEQEPNRLPRGHQIRLLSLPMLDQGNAVMVKEIHRMIRENNLGDFDPDARMVEAYQQFATDFADQYKQFVHAILEASGEPVLWHCTMGKDRAGFAAAIVLRLLGVGHQVVLEDYMLSAKYANSRPKLRFLLRIANRAQAANILKALLTVQAHWIQTAFQSIDERWGTFDRYTDRALGLSQADITQLRQSLLD
ncbi:MAG: tyrosine-protein phosphatase [Anaerolineae bacterium]|nr:tyrosine-protein phosphatase [Anaerolineae bacterium]